MQHGGEEHERLQRGEDCLEPLAALQERGNDARHAGEAEERESGYGEQVEVVAVAQEREPAPSRRRVRLPRELGGRQGPEPRQVGERYVGRDESGQVKDEENQGEGKCGPGPDLEPARVDVLRLVPHGQTPMPRSSERTPARRSTTI